MTAAEVVEDNSRLLRTDVASDFYRSWISFQGEEEAPSNDGCLK